MSRRAIPPLLLLLAYGLFVFSPLIADPDLWGHVRFGQTVLRQDILRTGQIVRADPYSYLTAGQPWVNHEWLSEVIQALAYELAGAGGIIALNLGVGLLTVSLLYGRLVARGMGPWGAALVMAGAAWMLRPGVLNARPQVWTYLMLALLALAIEGVEWRREHGGGAAQGKEAQGGVVQGRVVQGGETPPLCGTMVLAVAGIVAVWVNLHGGVLAGVGVLALWGAARLAEAAIGRRPLWGERGVAVALLLGVGSLLVNPYGAGLVAFLLRTATVARPEIADWEPARWADAWSQVWAAGVVVAALAVRVSRRPLRLPLLLPLAAVAAMPLLSIRHIPLFAVAAPALAAGYFAGAWARSSVAFGRRIPAWVTGRVLPVLAVVLAVTLVGLAAPRATAIVIDPRVADFPVRAVAVMKAAGVEGNLAVEFNWGEYVIWHLGPGVKVSVDGRRETVYGEAVYRENLDFMLGEGEWDRLVNRRETEMALVDKARPVYGLMLGKAGWVVAYEDEAAALFVREGAPALGRIAEIEPPGWPANGAGLAFPVE